MRYLLTFLLTISMAICHGPERAYPLIESAGQSEADFVPAGWTILDSAKGDLNKDGLADAALVLQQVDRIPVTNDPEDTATTQRRMLLMLFRKPDNSFALAGLFKQ